MGNEARVLGYVMLRRGGAEVWAMRLEYCAKKRGCKTISESD